MAAKKRTARKTARKPAAKPLRLPCIVTPKGHGMELHGLLHARGKRLELPVTEANYLAEQGFVKILPGLA